MDQTASLTFVTDLGAALIALGVIVVVLLFATIAVIYLIRASRYHKTRYAHVSRVPFWKVLFNTGLQGEYNLGKQLERFAPEGKMLFNVYVPKSDGSTSEIDALLVAPTGVYVFENKNYSGWIFGRAEDRMWTQTLNRHAKYHFLNPILQNVSHINALEAFLRLPREAFQPLVVFADKTMLKKVETGDTLLIKTSDVSETLARLEKTRERVLTDQEVELAYASLRGCANASSQVKQRHIQRIKQRKQR